MLVQVSSKPPVENIKLLNRRQYKKVTGQAAIPPQALRPLKTIGAIPTDPGAIGSFNNQNYYQFIKGKDIVVV